MYPDSSAQLSAGVQGGRGVDVTVLPYDHSPADDGMRLDPDSRADHCTVADNGKRPDRLAVIAESVTAPGSCSAPF
jgi:hypothetical protein